MKRFVTYLYECQRGSKSKNVGFIRVNVHENKAILEVYVRNIVRAVDAGKLYCLTQKNGLCGRIIGELRIENGQSDCRIEVEPAEIEEVEGIGIRLDSGGYIASCWRDTCAEAIVRGEFAVDGERKTEEILTPMMYLDTEPEEVSSKQEEEDVQMHPAISYEKLDLAQIRELPSPNWYLTTNSFLVHGFWNYGYLVLKKSLEEGQKKLSLGVPGIYEKTEAVMAVLFGFPDFEAIQPEMVERTKEKNQEVKEGTFGCWFVELKL